MLASSPSSAGTPRVTNLHRPDNGGRLDRQGVASRSGWRGTTADDVEHGRRWPDMRAQAARPSTMRQCHDLKAIDDRCRFEPEALGDRIIAGPGSLEEERQIDLHDYRACKAFLDDLLRVVYQSSPTMRRLLNHALDGRLREVTDRWLLDPCAVFATTATDEQILQAGNRRVLLVDAAAIRDTDAAVLTVYTSAVGEQRLDPFRACVHELVHIVTGLPDDEIGHPRGPVVEYTNKVLKECGHPAAARLRYLEAADQAAVPMGHSLEAVRGKKPKAAATAVAARPAGSLPSHRLMVEGVECKSIDDLRNTFDDTRNRVVDPLSEEIVKALIEQDAEYEAFSLFANEVRTRRHLVQIMRTSADLSIGYNHGKDWLSLPERYWEGLSLYDGKRPALPAQSEGAAGFRSRGKPSQAIEAIFAKSETTYYLECNTMAQSMHYYALLRAVGAMHFDECFADGIKIIPEWLSEQPGGEPFKSPFPVAERVVSIDQLLPGDWLYFVNHADYVDRHPGGAFAGEHTFYMGQKMYQGFGVDKVSHDGMVQQLLDAYNEKSAGKRSRPKRGVEQTDLQPTLSGKIPGIACGQVRRFADDEKIRRLLTQAPGLPPTPAAQRAETAAAMERRDRDGPTGRVRATVSHVTEFIYDRPLGERIARYPVSSPFRESEPLAELCGIAARLTAEVGEKEMTIIEARLCALVPSLRRQLQFNAHDTTLAAIYREACLHFSWLLERCVRDRLVDPGRVLDALTTPDRVGTRYAHSIAYLAKDIPEIAFAFVELLDAVVTAHHDSPGAAEAIRRKLLSEKDVMHNFYSHLANASGRKGRAIAAQLLFDALETKALLPAPNEISAIKSRYGAWRLNAELNRLRVAHRSAEKMMHGTAAHIEYGLNALADRIAGAFGGARFAVLQRALASDAVRKSLYAIECCSRELAEKMVDTVVTEAVSKLRRRHPELKTLQGKAAMKEVLDKLRHKAAPTYQKAMRDAYAEVRKAQCESALKAFDAEIADSVGAPDWQEALNTVTASVATAYRKNIADTCKVVAESLMKESSALVAGQRAGARKLLGEVVQGLGAVSGNDRQFSRPVHDSVKSHLKENVRRAVAEDTVWRLLQSTNDEIRRKVVVPVWNMAATAKKSAEQLRDVARDLAAERFSHELERDLAYAERLLRENERVLGAKAEEFERKRRQYQKQAENSIEDIGHRWAAIASVSKSTARSTVRNDSSSASWPEVPRAEPATSGSRPSADRRAYRQARYAE